MKLYENHTICNIDIYFNNADITNLGFILRHFELFYLNTLGFLTTQYNLFWILACYRKGVLDTTICDQVCQWLATGRWFSPGTLVSPTNKTNITEILLKVGLNTITPLACYKSVHEILLMLHSTDSYIMLKTNDFWRDDDQHAKLDFIVLTHWNKSLVDMLLNLGHIILILSQSVFVFTPHSCTDSVWSSPTNMFFKTILRGRHGRDRMVVRFTTNCAFSAYHH
jgi:hypothetical protein